MSIYSGTISHKYNPGGDHLTGELRFVEGATDNEDLALAFGVSPVGTGNRSFNDKIQLTELTNPNRTEPIYVDYQELDTVNDIDFIRKHINMVSDWQSLAQFIESSHNPDIKSALIEMNLNVNYSTLSNAQRSAVIRYIFGRATAEEVKKSVLTNDTDRLTDVIRRSVLEKSRRRTFEVYGLTGTITVTTTEKFAESEAERLKLTAKTVKIPVVTKVVIEGSKAGFNPKSNEAIQFNTLKRFLTDTLVSDAESYNIPRSYSHRFNETADLADLAQNLADKVSDDLNNSISSYLKAVNRLTPEMLGLSTLETFNPITAWKKVLLELGIESTSFTHIDKEAAMKDLRLYADNEMSAFEFLTKYSDKFLSYLKAKLLNRFAEGHYSSEAYLERVQDLLQDVVISPDETSKALSIIDDTVSDYKEIIESINKVTELLVLYQQTNLVHDTAIITEASKRLMEFVTNRRQDENAEAYTLFGKYFKTKLVALVSDKAKAIFKEINSGGRYDLSAITEQIMELHGESAFVDFVAHAPLQLSEKNYRDIIDNYIGGMSNSVESWINDKLEQLNSEKALNAKEIQDRLIELFEVEMDRRSEKDVVFDRHSLAEKYGLDNNFRSVKVIDQVHEAMDQLRKIVTEMSDVAIYVQIESYFYSLPYEQLQNLTEYDDQVEFVKSVYHEKFRLFVDNVLKKYDSQIRALGFNSKLELSELAMTRDGDYYLDDARKFIEEYLLKTTGGEYLNFDTGYKEIYSSLKSLQSDVSNELHNMIVRKISDNKSQHKVQSINETGAHETAFLDKDEIYSTFSSIVDKRLPDWKEHAWQGFISAIRKATGDALAKISDNRIFELIDYSLKNEYEIFVLDPEAYADKVVNYFKDKQYDKNTLLEVLKGQIKYAANLDGKVFERHGITVDAFLEDLEISPEHLNPEYKNKIEKLISLIKQDYFDKCKEYISNMPASSLETMFSDVDILEVDSDKVYLSLESNISNFAKESKLDFINEFNQIKEELNTMDHTDNWNASQWKSALAKYQTSELSRRIGYGFTDTSLKILENLHKQNILRSEIEDLLEDCNFHTERELWGKGLYETAEIENILIHSNWHNIVSEYLENKNLFTDESIQKYFNTDIQFDKKLVDTVRYTWNAAFSSAVYDKMHADDCTSFVDLKNKELITDKFIAYIDDNKDEFKNRAFSKVRATLARNTPANKPLTNDIRDVLQSYLVESLEAYLRAQYIPEKFINSSNFKNNFIDRFTENDEIFNYYKLEADHVDIKPWLRANLPFDNLNKQYWEKSLNYYRDSILSEMINKITDNSSLDYTKSSACNAVIKHPKEAADVYDDKISANDFVESYMLPED